MTARLSELANFLRRHWSENFTDVDEMKLVCGGNYILIGPERGVHHYVGFSLNKRTGLLTFDILSPTIKGEDDMAAFVREELRKINDRVKRAHHIKYSSYETYLGDEQVVSGHIDCCDGERHGILVASEIHRYRDPVTKELDPRFMTSAKHMLYDPVHSIALCATGHMPT